MANGKPGVRNMAMTVCLHCSVAYTQLSHQDEIAAFQSGDFGSPITDEAGNCSNCGRDGVVVGVFTFRDEDQPKDE